MSRIARRSMIGHVLPRWLTVSVLALGLGAPVAALNVESGPAPATRALHAEATDDDFELKSTVAFVSTRDNPVMNPLLAAEIYLMNPDGTNARRVTDNSDGDGFPSLSPDGKKIVFDSNRLRTVGDSLNTSDPFVMNTDGTEPTWLT